MKPLKDVTSAHILYYMMLFFGISFGIFGIVSTTSLFQYFSDGQIFVELPVHLEVAEESSAVNISDANLAVNEVNHLTAEITLTGSQDDLKETVIGFHLIKILQLVLYFSILFLVGKILKSVKDEEPFHEKNSKRLYAIGMIIILYRYFIWGYNYFFARPFFKQLTFTQNFTITHLDLYGG